MSDTDSDNTALSNNVYTFQSRDMTVCARGPNISNMTSLSLRNNMSSKQMHNFDKYQYGPLSFDQRVMYSRRETSPASMRSEILPRTFDRQFHHRAMSSQRSLLNGRSRSPMSMTSSASVSAADIIMAFKNAEFNKRDHQLIADAYNRYMKRSIRRKYEKRRRRLRLFTRRNRRGSGGESGEQGSDSSSSDDDRMPMRSSVFKENQSGCRPTKCDVTNKTRNTYQDSNMNKDCPENFKQKSFRNMFSVDTSKLDQNKTKLNGSSLLQKDRFKNGFLLPSQRFDNSLASVTIPEDNEKNHDNIANYSTKSTTKNNLKPVSNVTQTSDSDQEEIFSRTSRNNCTENQTTQKQNLITTNISSVNKISPIKKIQCEKSAKTNNCEMDDFVFAKPAFPARKLANIPKEKVIAKSAPSLSEAELCRVNLHTTAEPKKPQEIIQDKLNETTQSCISDVSSKPSFIKRKLFTQNLDVANKNNVNSDNLVNSPQTVYGTIQKEKNKIRKLVTSQSCLNTELLGEDNNYLDLIHKIVPAEKLNLTTQTIKSKVQNKKTDESEDKWDVASVLSVCNNGSLSDTFTDEEIFSDDNRTKIVQKNDNKNTAITKENNTIIKNVNVNNPIQKRCKVVLEPINKSLQQIKQNMFKKPINNNGTINNNIKSSVKSFWDTDVESDMETVMIPKQKTYSEDIVKTATFSNAEINNKIEETYKENDTLGRNTSIQTNITVNLQRLNTKNFRVKSHRDPSVKCKDSEVTTKTNLLQQTGAKKLNCQTNALWSVESHENNKIASITASNTKRKRICTTPIKQPPKKPKIMTEENDSMSSNNASKRDIHPNYTSKVTKPKIEKITFTQKPTESSKTVKLKKDLSVKNKTNPVEEKNTRNNPQKKRKTGNKENSKVDPLSSNLSVKNNASKRSKTNNGTAKNDSTFNMTLRSNNSLSKSFSPVLNNSRTRRQVNKYKHI